MNIELRTVPENEYAQFVRTMALGFGDTLTDDMLPVFERSMAHANVLAAYHGAGIVGTCMTYPLAMNVPERLSVPVAVVSDVTVLPTHRRRGILTRMMRQMLCDAHERGLPVAALGASESIIYGRFGYGIAANKEHWHIDRHHTTFANVPNSTGSLRFISKDDAANLLPAVAVRACADLPGFVAVLPEHWEAFLSDFESRRGDAGPMQFVVYEDGGSIDGYVIYRLRGRTVLVQDLMAITAPAHAALWSFCFGIDLRTAIEAVSRPTDDPLPWMLADPRRLERSPRDGMWLRVVDVRKALEARRYAVQGRIVLDIRDDFCEWNAGRYALEGDADGARCTPTAEAADLTLSAADLAAAYLGGVPFTTLARASRIDAANDAALRLADAMFRARRAPWWPHEL